MLLAIDARNSDVGVGVRRWGKAVWEIHFRSAAAERSADEWTWLLRSFLTAADIDAAELDEAIIASVVPRMTPRLLECARRLLPPGAVPLLLGPGVKTGLAIRTDNPAEIGADLIADAVAAQAIAAPPLLVVDFGVALSVVAVDERGALVGAAIAPGLEAAAGLLRDQAALLPEVRLQPPTKAIGRNSAEAIRSGLILGWTGLLDRLIDAMGRELGAPERKVAVVGTGENAEPAIVPTRGWDRWDPLLTMEGLYLIAEKNRGAS